MSTSTQDRADIIAGSFSASLIETPGLPHNLTVQGETAGDYRIGNVRLVRSHHSTAEMLVLDVTAELGPVENPHPEIERVFPVRYEEHPACHQYTEVEVVSGGQHVLVKVVNAL